MGRREIKHELAHGVLPQGYELEKKDVGVGFGSSGFGVVRWNDVGKRVWLRDYGIVMENDEQRTARKKESENVPLNQLLTDAETLTELAMVLCGQAVNGFTKDVTVRQVIKAAQCVGVSVNVVRKTL